MAFLPVLLDIVDQMNLGLDDQHKTYPMFFVPQRPNSEQGMRCRRGPASGACQRRWPRGNCAAQKTSDDFEVSVDVKSFKPEEISVKVKGNEIIVDGKHEEREDGVGFVSRQFSRRFILPQEFDAETVSTTLNAEGKLIVKALKPKPTAVESSERIIPIQRISTETEKGGQMPTESSASSEQDWEKVAETLQDENVKKAEDKPKQ